MSTIIGLDLGEFNCVVCTYDNDTAAARFATVPTDPPGLRTLLEVERPGLVNFETCTVSARVPTPDRGLRADAPEASRLIHPTLPAPNSPQADRRAEPYPEPCQEPHPCHGPSKVRS